MKTRDTREKKLVNDEVLNSRPKNYFPYKINFIVFYFRFYTGCPVWLGHSLYQRHVSLTTCMILFLFFYVKFLYFVLMSTKKKDKDNQIALIFKIMIMMMMLKKLLVFSLKFYSLKCYSHSLYSCF